MWRNTTFRGIIANERFPGQDKFCWFSHLSPRRKITFPDHKEEDKSNESANEFRGRHLSRRKVPKGSLGMFRRLGRDFLTSSHMSRGSNSCPSTHSDFEQVNLQSLFSMVIYRRLGLAKGHIYSLRYSRRRNDRGAPGCPWQGGVVEPRGTSTATQRPNIPRTLQLIPALPNEQQPWYNVCKLCALRANRARHLW